MLQRIKQTLAKGFWQTLAMLIVLVLAGPEIMISMELMAIVDLLGASTFVLAYVYALRAWLDKPIRWLHAFENSAQFFFPPLNVLRQMPSMAIHAVPDKICVLLFFSFLFAGMGKAYYTVFF